MYYDFYAQANHFSLLLPRGNCCSAPLPENTASSVSIDLSNTGKSYASAVKQTSQASSSVQASTYRKPELIQLAKAVASMNLPADPDIENDSIEECLLRRLTLPAGQKLSDPFQMTSLSNDFSQLPRFGLMGIFNHLIMSKADYDKSMLSSWRSFEEYNLCLNRHIRSLGVKTVQDLDGSNLFAFVAGVIPTQKEKNTRR